MIENESIISQLKLNATFFHARDELLEIDTASKVLIKAPKCMPIVLVLLLNPAVYLSQQSINLLISKVQVDVIVEACFESV